jgi:hypothetical protein
MHSQAFVFTFQLRDAKNFAMAPNTCVRHNSIISSIAMYNIWCLLWHNIALKWQFDNPLPCKKHGCIVSHSLLSIERCKNFQFQNHSSSKESKNLGKVFLNCVHSNRKKKTPRKPSCAYFSPHQKPSFIHTQKETKKTLKLLNTTQSEIQASTGVDG